MMGKESCSIDTADHTSDNVGLARNKRVLFNKRHRVPHSFNRLCNSWETFDNNGSCEKIVEEKVFISLSLYFFTFDGKICYHFVSVFLEFSLWLSLPFERR